MAELRRIIKEKKESGVEVPEELEEWNKLFDEKMKISEEMAKIREELKVEELKKAAEEFEASVKRVEELDRLIEQKTAELKEMRKEREELESTITELADKWLKRREKIIKLRGIKVTSIKIDEAIEEFAKSTEDSLSGFINKAIKYYLYHRYGIKITNHESEG